MLHMRELAAQQALQRAQQTVDLLRTVSEAQDDFVHRVKNSAGGYSLARALKAIAEGANLEAAAPIEFELSAQVAARVGREPRPGCVFVPMATRDLTAANASGGGYLVPTVNAPGGAWVDALRARSVSLAMGVQVVPMAGPNATIPRYTGASTGYWLTTEGAGPTESQGTLGQIAATPKTAGAYCEISRQLFLQAGPLVDAVILRELGNTVAAKVDTAILAGSGAAGEPTGIVNTAGVGSVTGTSIAYAGLAEFQTDVLTANASVNPQTFGYVTTPTVAGTLAGRQRFTGTDSPLWQGALVDGVIAGRKAMATTACPASTIIGGDWSSVALLDWGGLEVGVNPFAADASAYRAGLVGLRCFWSVDVVVLRPSAFSVATAVT